MTDRQRLPNRRLAETFDIEVVGLRYTCTVGRFADGRLAEVFLTNHRAGSDAGAATSDSAVVASICFQYGVPIEVTRKALMRDGPGRARTPLSGAKCGTADRPERSPYGRIKGARRAPVAGSATGAASTGRREVSFQLASCAFCQALAALRIIQPFHGLRARRQCSAARSQ
jgi:hypothetical protein